MKARTAIRRQGREAFSLIELLTVIAIIVILSTLSIVAVQGLLGSNSISGAGQHLQEVVSLARQVATTRSRPVEVRFYKQNNGNDFNGWQVILYKSDLTVDKRLTKAQFLPPGIVISGDTTANSTLLGLNLPLQTEAADGTITSGLSYASVRFSPSGGLKDVSPSATYYYYLLVVPQTNVNAPNRVVLSVDPISGVTQYAQP